MNFENLTIGLHVLIIPSMLPKFKEDQGINSYIINQMFKFQVFYGIKLCTKNKCIVRIINNI